MQLMTVVILWAHVSTLAGFALPAFAATYARYVRS